MDSNLTNYPILDPYSPEVRNLVAVYTKYVESFADSSTDYKISHTLFLDLLKRRIDLSGGEQNVLKHDSYLCKDVFLQTAEAYQDLKIELPHSEIENTYEKYGYVPLRKFGVKKRLVFCCGNLTPQDRNIYSIDYGYGEGCQYRKEHQHEDADTIDPDILRNPTVVGAFYEDQVFYEKYGKPIDKLKEFFPRHHYTCIHVEGLTLSEIAIIKAIALGLLQPEKIAKEVFRLEGGEKNYRWVNLELLNHMLDQDNGKIILHNEIVTAKKFKEILEKL
jgi:hypothetical protein